MLLLTRNSIGFIQYKNIKIELNYEKNVKSFKKVLIKVIRNCKIMYINVRYS